MGRLVAAEASEHDRPSAFICLRFSAVGLLCVSLACGATPRLERFAAVERRHVRCTDRAASAPAATFFEML
jgi:hypothetical protein